MTAPAPARHRPEKELLVASRPFTVEDRSKSWRATVSTFTVLAALTAGAVLIPMSLWPLRLLVALLEGLVIVRAFCLFHDFQHGALLRGSRLARGLFWLYGESILVPPSVWRETHNYHHAHTAKIVGSHIGSYPMLTPGMYRALSPTVRVLYRLARHPLNMVLAIFTVFGIGMCVRPFLRAPRKHWEGLVSCVAMSGLGVACVVTGHGEALLFGWGIPLWLGSMAGAYLFYAQHNYPGVVVATRQDWTFSGAALDSSSYLELGPVMRWFTANIGFHHVHHLNAAIPFYRLPEAMAQLPELQGPGKTSLSPRDVAACFRLKLWDPERGEMVGYPDDPPPTARATQPQA